MLRWVGRDVLELRQRSVDAGRSSDYGEWMHPISATTSTSYNFDGSIATIRYPTTRAILNYTTNGAGRQAQVQDINVYQLSGNAHYGPFGGLTSITSGSAPITSHGRLQ